MSNAEAPTVGLDLCAVLHDCVSCAAVGCADVECANHDTGLQSAYRVSVHIPMSRSRSYAAL